MRQKKMREMYQWHTQIMSDQIFFVIRIVLDAINLIIRLNITSQVPAAKLPIRHGRVDTQKMRMKCSVFLLWFF